MCSFSKNDKNHYKTCQAIYQEIQRNENNKFTLYHDSFYLAISGRGGRGGGGNTQFRLSLTQLTIGCQNKYILANKWI